jgi:hypothetical protein
VEEVRARRQRRRLEALLDGDADRERRHGRDRADFPDIPARDLLGVGR